MSNKILLDKVLKAYSAKHVPIKYTWKQHYINEQFSSENALELSDEERIRYNNRLLECGITIFDNIKQTTGGHACTLLDLYNIIMDEHNKNVNKQFRRVVYSTANGERPVGKNAFDLWNGFQVIDMDIKNAELAKKLKKALFEHLKKYNWFFGIALSSSGKGLHIYTKIQISENERKDDTTKKIAYLANFRHKYSFVYIICEGVEQELGFTSEELIKWMDLAMFKPQQGAFIPYDADAMFSTHFFEDFLYMDFDNVEDMGHPDVDWITKPELKELFSRWEWFEKDETGDMAITVKDAPELITDTRMPYHYKHQERWKLANTLVKLYGYEMAYVYMRKICTGVPNKELQADCTTANRHNKDIDIWAVNRLNSRHGFKIKINVERDENACNDVNDLIDSIDEIENPTILHESPNTKEFHITSKEYLGNIKNELLANCGNITLIEAGAGVGKTEMVKSIAREGHRIMLVMPFQSTLKAKVEPELSDGWQCVYGNRKVDLLSNSSISLTLDKFVKLNLLEIKENGFEYIFIDESHLLFQSKYRSVMPKVIEMVRNTTVPVIMMSGTPIGETVFFSDIVHLKVIKDETRKKEFHVILTHQPEDNTMHMLDSMAKDIVSGKRIIYPTNKGTLYKDRIEAKLKYLLENKYDYKKKVNVNYYKRENVGEEFMDEVNIEKTVKNTTVLLCSNFLSVGVDILDRYDFNIYFDELWMPQEIEQFANRLRSHDLFVYLFINQYDAEGTYLNRKSYKPLNMKYTDEELKFAKSVIDLCNSAIFRNGTEFKYNSLLASIVYMNKFIEYNEIEGKYYINDIAFKTAYFEDKYREFVEQLPILIKGMCTYGYLYTSEDRGKYIASKEELEGLNSASSEAQSLYKETQTYLADEIMDMITEDRLTIYRDIVAGRYELIKSNEWKEDLVNKKMYVKDVALFQRLVEYFVSLSKQYEPNETREIIDFCRNKNNTLNFASMDRMKKLINMVYSKKTKRLDLPIQSFMEKTLKFAEKKVCKKSDIDKFVNDFSYNYMKAESPDKTMSIDMSEIVANQVVNTFKELFHCLIKVSKPKDKKVEMEPIELMWKTREEKDSEMYTNSNIYVLAEFLEHAEINKTSVNG